MPPWHRTHSGALVGDARAFDAVLEHHGAITVASADELLASAALLALPERVGSGGLSVMIDSGGLRGTLNDLAEARGLAWSRFAPDTTAFIQSMLPSYLSAENPLDYGVPLSVDRSRLLTALWERVLADPGTAIGGFQFEVFDHFCYAPGLIDTAIAIAKAATKPFFVFNSFHCTRNAAIAARFADHGLPLINGESLMLAAADAVLRHRDLNAGPPAEPLPTVDPAVQSRWRERLHKGGSLDETQALGLLTDYGIEAVPTRAVRDSATAVAAAEALGYPVALKTGEPGIDHKSDHGGVYLGLGDAVAVARAYEQLERDCGPRAVVAAMVEAGVELAFGAVIDPQFGPLIMVAAGGKLVELLADSQVALAPFTAAQAAGLLDRLKARPLLDGLRGAPRADITALAQALSRFSLLAASLRYEIDSIDVNPIIAGPAGAVAVDALVIARAPTPAADRLGGQP